MKSKINKKLIIILSVIVIAIAIVLAFFASMILKGNKNPYGDRCDERFELKISNKKMKKIENKFKEIEAVNDVDVYTKLCTIKIIVNLKEDVDLEEIKTKATEILGIFSEDELDLYDFSLYVTSDNKESEVYPINVSKHNSREDFAW